MPKECPLFREPCKEHDCEWYIHIIGQNPQTKKPVDHWDCSVKWLPILQIESAQESRHAAAAIESFRNEMVRQNQQIIALQSFEADARVMQKQIQGDAKTDQPEGAEKGYG